MKSLYDTRAYAYDDVFFVVYRDSIAKKSFAVTIKGLFGKCCNTVSFILVTQGQKRSHADTFRCIVGSLYANVKSHLFHHTTSFSIIIAKKIICNENTSFGAYPMAVFFVCGI